MKKQLVFVLSMLVITGCGQTSTPAVETKLFSNIPEEIEVDVGETYSLHPIANANIDTDNNFKYSVKENSDLISISSEGKAFFYNEGYSVVSVYLDKNYNNVLDAGEKYQDVKFKINSPDEIVETNAVYVPSMAIDAYPNSSYDIGAIILPNDATYKKIRYISNDEQICNVDENGRLKNVAIGDAKITVYNDKNNNNKLDEDEKFNNCFVSVRAAEKARTISLPDSEITLQVGDTYPLNPIITPSDSGLYFGYESFNSDIASVSTNSSNAAMVRGRFPGTATIEVRCDGAFAYLKVNVVEKTLGDKKFSSKIHLNHDEIILDVGEHENLSYRVIPKTADTSLTFKSSNTSVATVNEKGELTAVGQGSSVIKVIDTASGAYSSVLVVVLSNSTYESTYYNNYYGNLQWDDSEDLINKLHNIISKDFTGLTYTSNWETNIYADKDINDSSKVDAIYSNDSIPKDNHGNTKGYWQREHCIPATLLVGLGTGDATKKAGRATDFHNLYAALGSGNSSRSNKNFGYADKDSNSYTDVTSYSYDKKVFEPNDVDKGKVARAAFYMSVMYNDIGEMEAKETWTFSEADKETHSGSKTKTITYNLGLKPVGITEELINYEKVSASKFLSNDTPSVQLLNAYYENILVNEIGTKLTPGTDDYRIAIYSLYANDYSANSIGNLSTLVEWNSYLVDDQEIQHCESVYSHVGEAKPILDVKQGNRNPFVDYPELVNYIYGPLKDIPGSIKQLRPSVINNERTLLWTTKTHY